jgi:hypothetical protein
MLVLLKKYFADNINPDPNTNFNHNKILNDTLTLKVANLNLGFV